MTIEDASKVGLTMTIEDARKAKDTLEKNITASLKRFSAQTGLVVEKIEIDLAESKTDLENYVVKAHVEL